jgi:hypothetical protein
MATGVAVGVGVAVGADVVDDGVRGVEPVGAGAGSGAQPTTANRVRRADEVASRMVVELRRSVMGSG